MDKQDSSKPTSTPPQKQPTNSPANQPAGASKVAQTAPQQGTRAQGATPAPNPLPSASQERPVLRDQSTGTERTVQQPVPQTPYAPGASRIKEALPVSTGSAFGGRDAPPPPGHAGEMRNSQDARITGEKTSQNPTTGQPIGASPRAPVAGDPRKPTLETIIREWAKTLTTATAPDPKQTGYLSWVRNEKIDELMSILTKAGYK